MHQNYQCKMKIKIKIKSKMKLPYRCTLAWNSWIFFQIANQTQQKNFFSKNKRAYKMRIIPKQLLGLCGLVSLSRSILFLCQTLASSKWPQTQNKKFL